MTSRGPQNGDAKQVDLLSPDSADMEEPSSPPENRKSGPSARRGKKQREKRMFRQKRRSTGVVNKKDVEESEKLDKVSNYLCRQGYCLSQCGPSFSLMQASF